MVAGIASLAACGGRAEFLNAGAGGADGGGFAVGGSGALGGAQAGGVAASGGGSAGVGASSGGMDGIGNGGATAAGAGNGDAGDGSDSPACSTGTHSGGYVDPCSGGSDSCHAYDLVAAYWNGSITGGCIEPVDDVSPVTGVGIMRGVLSDLHSWGSESFVETVDGRQVGAVGVNASGVTKLYFMDLASGSTGAVPIDGVDALAGAIDGKFVAASLLPNEQGLHIEVLDRSGTATSVTTLVDLQAWSNQIVLDHAKRRIYILGQPSVAANGKLYQVDLDTGASSSQDFKWSGFIGGVTADGQIVGAESVSGVWYGALIDPQTAVLTKQVPIGDLSAASYVVYDSTLNVGRTVGSDLQGKTFLYSFDFSSGTFSQVPTNPRYTLAKQ